MIPEKRLFTVPEAHSIFVRCQFPISLQTVYRWTTNGILERATVGGSVWVTRDSIIHVIRASTKESD